MIDQTTEEVEPGPIEPPTKAGDIVDYPPEPPIEPKQKLKIKLRDGKDREIQHMIQTSFWSADGKPISVEEFLNKMFGVLPDFFKDENELRTIWSNPTTRKVFLDKIAELGFGKEQLESIQKMIDAENSDLFDVLGYVAFALQPITRAERIQNTKYDILGGLPEKHREFIEFVLAKYQERGVEELGEEKLSDLLKLKYHAISDAERLLGGVDQIRSLFFSFQRELYKS